MTPESPRADSDRAAFDEDSADERLRTAHEAERGHRRVEIEWIVVPAVIVAVFVIGFGLKFLFG
jgi:hypothetical protein